MDYVAFVGTEGKMPATAVAEMNRDFPAYQAEMQARGVKSFGRELDFPPTAVTVRVRDGETLISDGPFAETKEFIGGFDLLDCADLDEAIEVEGKSPVARFLPFEIRPFRGRLRRGSASGPLYLLTVWANESPVFDERYDAWQRELEDRGAFVFGNALGGPETAMTLRTREGAVELTDGPFLDLDDFIAGLDVIACSDRQQAIAWALTHPLAQRHAIEVRPFHPEGPA